MYLSVVGRRYLESKNVNLLDISLDATDQIEYGNNIVFRQVLTATIYTEWTETIYDIPMIEGITITGISESII